MKSLFLKDSQTAKKSHRLTQGHAPILPASFHIAVKEKPAPSLEAPIRKPTQQPKKGVLTMEQHHGGPDI